MRPFSFPGSCYDARMKPKANTTCRLCGATFHCGVDAEGPCWCMAMPKIMPMEDATSCLCPNCLERKIARRQEQRKETAL